ncbi:hypothetical protein SKUN_00902 [Spiroplasma kunkelii CR2-3x]|uniref:Lipoprotein n=1 Tax=Spiroplasma kunkelii CR2-3x TaxID=273035 RepID=A0A0K2JGT6_SPIKU|nr:lipoprotein [Spiroplasma kunkelii]ALA97790.1 hypothetical protein SKUN_00902 [Spiroplasma kunkelii CR2-3x]
MKKLLSLLTIFSLSFTNTVNLISCDNIANNKPKLPPSKTKLPIVKDVFLLWKIKTRNYSRN